MVTCPSHISTALATAPVRFSHLPMVGIVVTISPSFSLYRMVVLPAASRPTIKIRISFLPKRPLKMLANAPISVSLFDVSSLHELSPFLRGRIKDLSKSSLFLRPRSTGLLYAHRFLSCVSNSTACTSKWPLQICQRHMRQVSSRRIFVTQPWGARVLLVPSGHLPPPRLWKYDVIYYIWQQRD